MKRPPGLPTGRVGAIVLSGAAAGAVMYAIVAGAAPLYESEAVIAAPAPGLLTQFKRLSAAAPPTAAPATLGRDDLAALGPVLGQVRARHAQTAGGAALELRMEPSADEARIIVRAHDRRLASAVANEVAAGVISVRERTLADMRTVLRAQIALASALARRSPQARPTVTRLRERRTMLNTLRASGGGLTVLRPARTPARAVGPRVGRDVGLAVVFGVLAALSVGHLRRVRPSRPRARRVERVVAR